MQVFSPSAPPKFKNKQYSVLKADALPEAAAYMEHTVNYTEH